MKALSLIISAKNLHSSWIENAEPNIKFQVTESGWMEADSFDDWFTNVFVAETRHLKGPTLLILDGHKSHLSMRIAQTARANQVSIVCLPAHSTHLLQPLDVAVFSPVKTAWRKIVSEGNINNSYKNIDKKTFTEYFSKLIMSKTVFRRSHSVSGFDTTGIFPLDRARISPEKLKINKTFEHIASARRSAEDEASDSNGEPTGRDEEPVASDEEEDEVEGQHVIHYGRDDDDDETQSQVVIRSLRRQSTQKQPEVKEIP